MKPNRDYSEQTKKYSPAARLTFASGMCLVELLVATAIGLVISLTIGALLVGGQHSWRQVYNAVEKQAKKDAQTAALTFASIARKANRGAYALYDVQDGVFSPVSPSGSETLEICFGDAVELCYWDVALDEADSHGLLDDDKEATAYVLFYLDGTTLKADYGPWPPGAIAADGTRNIAGVDTVVLAENVQAAGNGPFSHTVVNGAPRGCVRMHLNLIDAAAGDSVEVMSASLIRNMWPR